MSKKQSKKSKNKKISKVKAISKKKAKPSKPAKSVGKNKVVKKAIKPAPKKVKKVAKKTTVSKNVVKPASKKVVAKPKAIKKIVKAKVVAKKKVASKPIKKATKAIKPKAVKKAVAKKVKAVKPIKTKAKPVVKEKIQKVAKEKKEVVTTKNSIPTSTAIPLKKPSRAKSGRKPKNKNDDDEPEVIDDPLLEEIIKSTKQPKKPKLPKIIKTFVNPMAALQIAAPEGSSKQQLPKKEPKGKFELEFVIRTSAPLLYEFISTPSGLSEWFADDVNIKDGVFTFFWDGSEQKAKLLAFKEDKFIRFQWVDKPIGTYVEFRIEKDELTGDVSLMITDFAEAGPDTDSSKKLWDSQVNTLLHVLGSF